MRHSLLLILWTAAFSTAAERPNFVVIMADDLGYGDITRFGRPDYQTPHLDRLASEGMMLTDFHANGPVCSPTRAALLTGRYQQRAGIPGVVFADPQQNRHHGLQDSEYTFAQALREVGYATGVFGKWHVGYEPQYNPVHRGFDEFVGYVSGNVCYQSHLDRMGIADWWHQDQLTPEDGYTTHLITQHTIEFIRSHQDQPFCVYVAHECVHSPFQGPHDPPVRKLGQVGDLRSAQVKDIDRAYMEMIVEMDHGIGKIVHVLRELKLHNKTLVLFFSDNGATPRGSNGPFRGHKGSVWEGGHRVPCIAWQPGTVPRNSTSAVTAATIDIMPTLLELANAKPSPDKPLDGVSLVPVLTHQEPLPPRQLFWEYRDSWAVREGDWKLVSEKRGKQPAKKQLFDLAADPGEQHDQSASHASIVQSLTDAYEAWQTNVQATATTQPE